MTLQRPEAGPRTEAFAIRKTLAELDRPPTLSHLIAPRPSNRTVHGVIELTKIETGPNDRGVINVEMLI